MGNLRAHARSHRPGLLIHGREFVQHVVAAMTASIGKGVGAIAVDGVLLDLAHLKMARTILDRAELVERAEAKGVRT